MVAYISEYDPTRLGARDSGMGGFLTNPMLERNFSRKYLAEVSYVLAPGAVVNAAVIAGGVRNSRTLCRCPSGKCSGILSLIIAA
jgi:hypothetical protein